MNSTPSSAYIAYPIDQARLPQKFYDEINVASGALRDLGIGVCYDPGDAFTVVPGTMLSPIIARVNRAALDAATHVLAFVPKGVPMVGTPMEVERAASQGKPVAVVTDTESWSLQGLGDHVRLWPMDEEGVAGAVSWLAAQDPAVTREDPLPVLARAGAARLPTRGYPDDAGLDLYVSEATIVRAGKFVDVPCGLAVELPEWSWGMLTGRSSALRRLGLLVNTGIIDHQYRGELFAGTFNLTQQDVLLEPGQRIAQLIVMPNLTKDLQPVWTEELSKTDRGENGFGSTG